MAFTEHKITAFQKKIANLPDQPNLSAAELKAYFDSSPEELRQSVNDLCTDAERLDNRVSGIVAETFGDTIPKTMLSTELQAEIDAKAEQAANTAAHSSLQSEIYALRAQKCEVYIGTYMGDGAASQFVDLGFTPKAVLVFAKGCALYPDVTNAIGGVLALPEQTILINGYHALDVAENGFIAYENSSYKIYFNNGICHYIAFR